MLGYILGLFFVQKVCILSKSLFFLSRQKPKITDIYSKHYVQSSSYYIKKKMFY